MNCPKCISPMELVTFGGMEVHRCTGCHGLYFGEFETEQLRRMPGADSIDTGDTQIGREFNEVDCIQCPRCGGGSRMIRMVDREQHHIWFEHCTVCGGSFFDAGEFRDLAHHNILDFFRDLLAPARR